MSFAALPSPPTSASPANGFKASATAAGVRPGCVTQASEITVLPPATPTSTSPKIKTLSSPDHGGILCPGYYNITAYCSVNSAGSCTGSPARCDFNIYLYDEPHAGGPVILYSTTQNGSTTQIGQGQANVIVLFNTGAIETGHNWNFYFAQPYTEIGILYCVVSVSQTVAYGRGG